MYLIMSYVISISYTPARKYITWLTCYVLILIFQHTTGCPQNGPDRYIVTPLTLFHTDSTGVCWPFKIVPSMC